ncbi:MAG TPA: hypothetical protein DCR26_09220 [Porphyromonadaceae bacterium]|nr:hypothetical protein [Porphyromonadaceae bacterium]
MKLLPYAILAALLLSIASCRRDNAALERMRHAEAIMHTSPDSALAIIRSIPDSTLHSAEARALHALLLTQALDKNYLDLTDDSLIVSALDYYSPSPREISLNNFTHIIKEILFPDKHHMMLARFYYARILKNKGEKTAAIAQYRKAEYESIELRDTFYISQIYGDLAILYGEVLCVKEELLYARKAYEILKPWNHPDYTLWGQCEVARALINNYRHSEAIPILDSILSQTALINEDVNLNSESIILLSICHYTLGNNDSAYSLLNELKSRFPSEYTLQLANNHLYTAIQSGNKDEADSILKNHILADSAGFVPSYIYESQGDFKQAYLAGKKEAEHDWKWFRANMLQELTIADTEYHINELNKKDNERATIKVWLIVGTITVLCAIFTLLFILKKRKEENQKAINALVNRAQLLIEEINSLKTTNNTLGQTLNRLFGERFKTIDSLLAIYSAHKGKKVERQKIYEEVDRILNSFESNEINKRLIELVDLYFDGMASRFKEDFPDLKEDDYMLFLYLVCGFSNYSIMLLLDVTITTVYSRKKRVKAKIMASQSKHADKFLSFF